MTTRRLKIHFAPIAVFHVQIKHGATVTTPGRNRREAIRTAMRVALCPRSAVVRVRKQPAAV